MIFDPHNRRSVQNPQSGGDNISTTRQVINAIFGRRPTFYNAGLGELIHPTVDTSLYYPLKPIIKIENKDMVVAGTIHQWQIKPKIGYHWMINFLSVGVDGEHIGSAGALSAAVMGIQTDPFTGFQILNSQVFPATLPVTFAFEDRAPLIGGKRSGVDNVTVPGQPYYFEYQGIKSVYLSSNNTMIMFMNQNPVAIVGEVQLVYSYLELPESQPFGPALTF